jgi:hypothetical protein
LNKNFFRGQQGGARRRGQNLFFEQKFFWSSGETEKFENLFF